MKKFLLWATVGIAGIVVVLVLARNPIARKSVELGAERITGFPLTIGAVNVGLFNGQLDVENLKLMNPPDFEERQFIKLESGFKSVPLSNATSALVSIQPSWVQTP